MILTGIENLANDEALINATIAETQQGTNKDHIPPDTPLPVKIQHSASLCLSSVMINPMSSPLRPTAL